MYYQLPKILAKKSRGNKVGFRSYLPSLPSLLVSLLFSPLFSLFLASLRSSFHCSSLLFPAFAQFLIPRFSPFILFFDRRISYILRFTFYFHSSYHCSLFPSFFFLRCIPRISYSLCFTFHFRSNCHCSLSTPFLDAFLLRCIRQISHPLHFTSPFYSNYQCFFSILFLSSQYSLNFSFPTLHLSSSTLSFFRCIRPISPLHFSFFTPVPITTALSSFDVFFLSNFSSSHPFPSHFILFLRVLPLFLCSSYHRSLSISTPFFFLRRIPYATRQPPIFLSRADSCLQPVPRFICEFYSLCG